jgi:mono/diheme cytochrome c family protein
MRSYRRSENLAFFTFLLMAGLAGRGIALACLGADCANVGAMHEQKQGQMMNGANFAQPPASPTTTSSGGNEGAAEQIFNERCVACHGTDGRGNGPAAASLRPAPINFHDAQWQKSVSDETIGKAIVEGGAAVGRSNQMMPNPDLEEQPDVVKALIARVRGFGK